MKYLGFTLELCRRELWDDTYRVTSWTCLWSWYRDGDALHFFCSSKCSKLREDMCTSKESLLQLRKPSWKEFLLSLSYEWLCRKIRCQVSLQPMFPFCLQSSSLSQWGLPFLRLQLGHCSLDVHTEGHEWLAVELRSVVSNDGSMNPKPAYNRYLHKFLNVRGFDTSEWFYFCPFGEVVSSHHEKLVLSCLYNWEAA